MNFKSPCKKPKIFSEYQALAKTLALAAFSAIAVVAGLISFSSIPVNDRAQEILAAYNEVLEVAGLPISQTIFLIDSLFGINIPLPEGWSNVFVIIMLKPIADVYADWDRKPQRQLTLLFYVLSGFVISLSAVLILPSDLQFSVSILPLIIIVASLSLYELFKSVYVGWGHIPARYLTIHGDRARIENIKYYLWWYFGGFTLIGVLCVMIGAVCIRYEVPGPSATGSIAYLVLLTTYHYYLAIQADRNNTKDFERGVVNEIGPPFIELARSKWTCRLLKVLLLTFLGLIGSFYSN